MYTACTSRLAQAIEVPSLAVIPRVTIYVALLAWAATLAGLVHQLATRGGGSAFGGTRPTCPRA